MVDSKRDLDLVRADAWILGGLGLGLRTQLGPVAAQGAVQPRPILPKNGPRDTIRGACKRDSLSGRLRKVLRGACLVSTPGGTLRGLGRAGRLGDDLSVDLLGCTRDARLARTVHQFVAG